MKKVHRNGRTFIRSLTIGLSLFFCSSHFAFADVFTLNNGAVITAEWLNSDDKAATVWKLRQSNGVELEIARGSVKSVLSPIPSTVQYLKNIGKVDDNVESHRKIVDWSTKQGLIPIADAHRDRVVELDPNDKSAWSALGYTESSGTWVRKDTYWKRKGMESKAGKWRFPQDIAAEERVLKAKTQISELNRRIDQAFRDIRAENNRASVSRQFLQDLNDPMAIPKLSELMVNDRKNLSPDFRLSVLEIISRIKSPGSTLVIVDTVLYDPNIQVVNECIGLLSQNGRELAVVTFIGKLTNQNPLKDDPGVINRAAMALSEIGDERCIPKLIDCLVTKHYVDPPAQPGTQAAQVNGAVNFAPSGKKTRVERQLQNADVLSALQTITKESGIQFDKDAWLNWYAENFAPSRPDVLRDF